MGAGGICTGHTAVEREESGVVRFVCAHSGARSCSVHVCTHRAQGWAFWVQGLHTDRRGPILDTPTGPPAPRPAALETQHPLPHLPEALQRTFHRQGAPQHAPQARSTSACPPGELGVLEQDAGG